MSLKDSDLDRYREQGFATCRQLFSPEETEYLRAECSRIWQDIDPSMEHEDVLWRDHATRDRVPDRLNMAHTHSPNLAEVTRHKALCDAAVAIVGGPVFVLTDKVIYKRPGTAGYGPHQDFAYWDHIGLDADALVNAMIAISDITSDHGPLELYPGLHSGRFAADPNSPLDIDPRALEGHQPYEATVSAGDVVFFHSLTPHRSAPNRADSDRTIYIITYGRDTGDAAAHRARYRNRAAVVFSEHRKPVA